MSSSKDTRISRRTPATTQNEIQRGIDKEKNKKVTVRVILVCALILAIVLVFINTGFFYRTIPALTVANTDYSIADFNFYYINSANDTYSSLYSSYGDYASYMLDPQKPYDQQQYSEEATWDDYFTESAQQNMRAVTLMNILADNDEEFALTAEQEAELEQLCNAPQEYADAYKVNVATYLGNVYGRGMNRKTFVENTTDMYIASCYSSYMLDTLEYSDAEIENYYNANRSKIDTVTYRVYEILAETGDDVDAEQALADAEAAAQALVDGADSLENFEALVAEYEKENELEFGVGGGTYAKYSYVENYPYASWLYDATRVSGDVTVIANESETGYYAVYFDSFDTLDYPFIDIRHMVVYAEEDAETGEISDAAMADALTQAEAILDEWKSGAATEESFVEVYEKYAAEGMVTGSHISELYHGSTNTIPFEEWCFDEARQPGDCDIVELAYGYHIIYFVGYGENARNAKVVDAMASEEYDAWLTENIAQYPAVLRKFGYYFTRDF
ncbi:MAG: hypothetical protein E7487_09440 [Ruminococcaceae bacterium]|nr:hypothetical protein [Oscillospiraceae bacterium]